MDIYNRSIAFTSITVTGVEHLFMDEAEERRNIDFIFLPGHQICEIGLELINDKFKIIDTLSVKLKVSPELIDKMPEKIKKLINFNEEVWRREAINPKEAIWQYLKKTKDAIFASYRTDFDWKFLQVYFDKYQFKHEFYFHRLDILSYTKGFLDARKIKLPCWDLPAIAEYFKIPLKNEGTRAINYAEMACEIYKKINSLVRCNKKLK